MKPLNIILLGRSGSGKGTQAKFLAREFGFKRIATGSLLRKVIKKGGFLGRKLDQAVKKGKLAPTWLVEFLWLRELFKVDPKQGVIFDGSPRKLEEAKFLDDALAWIDRKNLLVLFINISRKEALRRLLKRGRKDDSPRAINKRLDWFNKDVMSVVKHYKKTAKLIRINGQQSIEGVFKEIKSFL